MTFFESIHCTSRAHCRTCRAKHKGRSIRQSWGKIWGLDVNFECPHGNKWDEAPAGRPAIFIAPDGKKETFTIEAQYSNVKNDVAKNDSTSPLMQALQVQIRQTDRVLNEQRDNSPCWKRKQMVRVIQMWQKIKRNGNNAGVIVKFENNVDFTEKSMIR